MHVSCSSYAGISVLRRQYSDLVFLFFSRVKEVLKRKAKYMYTPMSMRGSGDTVNLEELSQRIGDERLTVGEALFFSFGKQRLRETIRCSELNVNISFFSLS